MINKKLSDFPELLTVAHLSALTGLSEQTIRAECAKGALPALKIGRTWFVPKARFVELLGVA